MFCLIKASIYISTLRFVALAFLRSTEFFPIELIGKTGRYSPYPIAENLLSGIFEKSLRSLTIFNALDVDRSQLLWNEALLGNGKSSVCPSHLISTLRKPPLFSILIHAQFHQFALKEGKLEAEHHHPLI